MHNLNLIFGANGLVGQHLKYHLRDSATDAQCNILDRETVLATVRDVVPRFIYLAAAMTDVDKCEAAPEASFAANVQGVANVVAAARYYNAKLVFFSTDYVFDGAAGPYNIRALPNPLSVYGRHKLQAEHFIMAQMPNYTIIRTTQLFGRDTQQRNFVYSVVNALRNKHVYRAATDQSGTPTYAKHLAQTAITLAQRSYNDVFHVVGQECVNRYNWAREIAKAYDCDPAFLVAVNTAELGQTAPRPAKGGLTNSVFEPSASTLYECLKDMQLELP